MCKLLIGVNVAHMDDLLTKVSFSPIKIYLPTHVHKVNFLCKLCVNVASQFVGPFVVKHDYFNVFKNLVKTSMCACVMSELSG